MPLTVPSYPQVGTKADQILEYIRAHPQVSRNGIIEGLGFNPGIVRRLVGGLLSHNLIQDDPDPRGHHRYTVTK